MPTNEYMLSKHRSLPELPRGPHHRELNMLNSRKWNRPKNSCDVTEYAETYVRMALHSPFAQKLAGR
jgi:hypothetical protein